MMEGLATYRALDNARKKGMSFSAFLEQEDPSSEHNDGTDAFQRQLALYDIRTKSDPISGLPSHTFDRFFDDEGGHGEARRSLVAEYINRTYREASHGLATGKRLFESQAPVSYTVYPPTVLPELRFNEVQPSALPYLLARTRTISSETFTALYLNDSNAQTEAHMSRVQEGAEIPTVQFQTSEASMRVKKYGRRMRMTYEQMRRMNIDLVGWAINYIAAVAARDKEDDAVNILLSGDGNANTSATNVNGSTMDAGAGGNLTLKMLMNFRLQKYTRPYRADVVVGKPADLVNLFLLSAGSANLAPVSIVAPNSGMNPMNISMVRNTLDGLAAVDNTNVPSNKLLFIDHRYALEMVMEANSDIVEYDRIIQSQWNEIAMTENIGWAMALRGLNLTLAYTA